MIYQAVEFSDTCLFASFFAVFVVVSGAFLQLINAYFYLHTSESPQKPNHT